MNPGKSFHFDSIYSERVFYYLGRFRHFWKNVISSADFCMYNVNCFWSRTRYCDCTNYVLEDSRNDKYIFSTIESIIFCRYHQKAIIIFRSTGVSGDIYVVVQYYIDCIPQYWFGFQFGRVFNDYTWSCLGWFNKFNRKFVNGAFVCRWSKIFIIYLIFFLPVT
jgi:hypothetical protein